MNSSYLVLWWSKDRRLQETSVVCLLNWLLLQRGPCWHGIRFPREKFHCRSNCVYQETVGVESRHWLEGIAHFFSHRKNFMFSSLIKSDCLASIALFLCPLNPIPTSSSLPLGCAVISLCPHWWIIHTISSPLSNVPYCEASTTHFSAKLCLITSKIPLIIHIKYRLFRHSKLVNSNVAPSQMFNVFVSFQSHLAQPTVQKNSICFTQVLNHHRILWLGLISSNKQNWFLLRSDIKLLILKS